MMGIQPTTMMRIQSWLLTNTTGGVQAKHGGNKAQHDHFSGEHDAKPIDFGYPSTQKKVVDPQKSNNFVRTRTMCLSTTFIQLQYDKFVYGMILL